RLHRRLSGRRAKQSDYIDRNPRQFAGCYRQLFRYPVGPAIFEDDVLPFNIVQLVQFRAKRLPVRIVIDDADTGDLPGPDAPARPKRRQANNGTCDNGTCDWTRDRIGRGSANKCYKLPAPHRSSFARLAKASTFSRASPGLAKIKPQGRAIPDRGAIFR